MPNSNRITHFYSDPHFGHRNIIEFAYRPFQDKFEMTRELIARYNSTVGPDDLCAWLGDCYLKMGSRAFRQILEQLNGRKALIIGNHDQSQATMIKLGFVWASYNHYIELAGCKIRLNHFPYANNPKDPRRPTRKANEILLHGHTHDRRVLKKGMIHVGVDAWDYYPVRREVICSLVKELM